MTQPRASIHGATITAGPSIAFDPTTPDTIEAIDFYDGLTREALSQLTVGITYRICIRFKNRQAAEYFFRSTKNKLKGRQDLCPTIITNSRTQPATYEVYFPIGAEETVIEEILVFPCGIEMGLKIKEILEEPGASTEGKCELWPAKKKISSQTEVAISESKAALPATPKEKKIAHAEVKLIAAKAESKESKSTIREEKRTASTQSSLCDPPYDFITVRTVSGKERSKLCILFNNRDAAIKFHQELNSAEAKITEHPTLRKITVSVSLPLYKEQEGIDILKRTPGCEAAASIVSKELADKRSQENPRKDEKEKKESKLKDSAIEIKPILENLTGITCNFKTPFKVTQDNVKQKFLESSIRLDFTNEAKANEFFKLFKKSQETICDYIIQPSASNKIVGAAVSGSGKSVYIKKGKENAFFGAMETILGKKKSHTELRKYFYNRLTEPMYHGCCCPSIFNNRFFKYSKDRKIEASLFYLLKGQGAAMSSTYSGALNQGTLVTTVQSIRNAG